MIRTISRLSPIVTNICFNRLRFSLSGIHYSNPIREKMKNAESARIKALLFQLEAKRELATVLGVDFDDGAVSSSEGIWDLHFLERSGPSVFPIPRKLKGKRIEPLVQSNTQRVLKVNFCASLDSSTIGSGFGKKSIVSSCDADDPGATSVYCDYVSQVSILYSLSRLEPDAKSSFNRSQHPMMFCLFEETKAKHSFEENNAISDENRRLFSLSHFFLNKPFQRLVEGSNFSLEMEDRIFKRNGC